MDPVWKASQTLPKTLSRRETTQDIPVEMDPGWMWWWMGQSHCGGSRCGVHKIMELWDGWSWERFLNPIQCHPTQGQGHVLGKTWKEGKEVSVVDIHGEPVWEGGSSSEPRPHSRTSQFSGNPGSSCMIPKSRAGDLRDFPSSSSSSCSHQPFPSPPAAEFQPQDPQ